MINVGATSMSHNFEKSYFKTKKDGGLLRVKETIVDRISSNSTNSGYFICEKFKFWLTTLLLNSRPISFSVCGYITYLDPISLF